MAPHSMKAAIVSVGNELLFGLTVDTNAAWLGRSLADLGLPVVRRFTVGDVAVDIREALSRAMECADLVLVSGGLGPTPDDLTKGVVAQMLDRPLVVDSAVWSGLEARFRAAGFDSVPALSRGQAEVPEGARALDNPRGTAPGLIIEEGGVRSVLLPGVPRELKAIFKGDLSAVLEELGAVGRERVRHRVIHTTGIPEPRLAEIVEAHLTELPSATTEGISLAYLPDLYGVDLRFTLAGSRGERVLERLARLVGELTPILEEWVFEAESGDLAESVSRELARLGRTLAVAESCTGGLVAKRMTDRAGSSEIFVGGVTAYSNAVKINQVGVSPSDLARDGAGSEVVARQLAEGVAKALGADVGIGVTGVAGPGGGSEEKPVGTVWIGVALDGLVTTERKRFPGDRESVRERAAQASLAAVYRRLRSFDG